MKSVLRTMFLITILVLIPIVVSGCTSARFSLSKLSVIPEKIAVGESVNVTAILLNTGDAEGVYPLALRVDSTTIHTENISMIAGMMKDLQYQVSRNETGICEIGIGDLSCTLEVVEPARCEYSSLEIIPSEVILGDNVTVTIEASNPGGLDGCFCCNLTVNSRFQETREFDLVSGNGKTISFTYTPEYGNGSNIVEVGELTETITVLKPADIRVSRIDVSDDVIDVTEEAKIIAILKNYGDIEGDYTAWFTMNKAYLEERTLTLSGGESTTVEFTVHDNRPGYHTIEFGGKKKEITITPVIPEGYLPYESIGGETLIRHEDQHNFHLLYPEGWTPMDNDNILLFIGPQQSNGTNVAINILSEAVYGSITLREYFEATNYELFNEYNQISVEELKINGYPAIKHICTISQQGYTIQTLQVMVLRDNVVYILSCNIDSAYYNQYADIFELIYNSFTFMDEY